MKRVKKADQSIIILIIIILIVVANIIFFFFLFQTDKYTKFLKKNDPINTLIIVSDNDHLLFLELFLYNPVTNKGGLFFIPPNLGTKIFSLDRIDKLSVLYKSGNLNNIHKKVEKITDIEISFIIEISLDNITNIVDLVGGIELFIPNSINTISINNKILLPSGSVLLDGDKVRQFILFEETIFDDMKSAERKHGFFKSLLKKLSNEEINNYILNKKPFKLLKNYIQGSFSSNALHAFISELKKLDAEQLILKHVLGSYRHVDGIDGNVLFPHYEGSLMKVTVNQTLETMLSLESVYENLDFINIEIFNGTDIIGLAKEAKILFESLNINVNNLGNADNDQHLRTQVLDRKGDLLSAKKIAEVIKCDNVETQIIPDSEVDVTIILGKDFNGQYCEK